jgi:squalene-associated FAD-dependent desaturase
MKSRVCVIGGGLAGIAAASALQSCGYQVVLLEARARLGGRAASFQDRDSGEWIDLCQHVSMGCCTNLSWLCQQAGIEDCFARSRSIHFVDTHGRVCSLSANRFLPAPLHLLPALLRMRFLTLGDRISIGRAIVRLLRMSAKEAIAHTDMSAWLIASRQSPVAIRQFWEPVLVSALGDSLNRVSVSAARKVFADGFCSSPEAYELQIPSVPLSVVYGERLFNWLRGAGVAVELGEAVKTVTQLPSGQLAVTSAQGATREFSAVVLAVPWWQVASLFEATLVAKLPSLAGLSRLAPSPITGIHLWFDRPITDLPHAVLLNRLSQWLFSRPGASGENSEYYYQVVISGSHDLATREKQIIIDEVVSDLQSAFPRAQQARLVRSKSVTEPHAVFTPNRESESLRPAQKTNVPSIFLAGDWTVTGWPATMEGAVRSGFLAAEEVARQFQQPQKFLRPDLQKSGLAGLFIR